VQILVTRVHKARETVYE